MSDSLGAPAAAPDPFSSRDAAPPARPRSPHLPEWLVVGTLAVALLLAGAAYSRARRAERRRHELAKLSAIAALKVDQLTAWRRERLADAEGLAESMPITRWMAGAARGAAAPGVVEWLDSLRGRHGFHSVFLFSADGRRLLVVGPDDLGRDEVDGDAVRAVHQGAPYLSDLHGRERPDGPAHHLDAAAPVRGADGQVLGAALIQIDPSSMLEPLRRWPIPTRSAELLLVRQEGSEVAVLSASREAGPGPRLSTSRAGSPEVYAALGERTALEGRDWRGVPVLAATRPVPGSNWGLVAKEDLAEAYAPLPRELAMATAVLVLVGASATSLLLLWRRRQSTVLLRAQLAAERERRVLRERVDVLFRQSNDVMALVDEQGRILDANDRAAEVWQLPRERILGVDFRALRVPEESGRRWPEVVGERESLVYETRHRRGDGSTFPVEVSVRAVSLDGRRYYQCTLRDITLRKLQEAETRQLESRLLLADRLAALGTLSAGVAHEINNPLAYVISNLGYARRTLARLPEPPVGPMGELGPALAEAAEGCERIRLIVRDLKTFTHAADEPRGPVDLHAVLRSALNLAGSDLRHRARVEKDLAPAPRVDASEARLGQVFLNLLVNATQALSPGASERNVVRVATRTDPEGRAVVEVSDNGPGIPPENLGRVFDPFFTTKGPGEGTGLGLSICHGIVRELGGAIDVESEPGKGALFRVVLPPSRARAPAPRPEAPASGSARPLRILVVDDEPRLADSYQRLLQPEYEVTTSTSGRAALELLRSGARFDAVLCDLMMPEMTGMELHAAVSATAPPMAARMIFVTGGAFTEGARAFLDGVPNPRIEKPFRREALERLLAEVVGGSR